MTPARATIIAAVITAVAGIITTIITVGFSHGSASSTAAASDTSHVAATGQSTTSPGPLSQVNSGLPTSAANGNATVLWHGQMTLTDNSDGPGVDVGEVPPRVNENGPGVTSFWLYEGQFETGQSAENLMGEWSSSTPPTMDQCANVLRTAPVEKISYHSGLQFCTHGLFTRRVGFVRVLSYNGSTANIDVTIWNEQLPWS